MKQMKKMKKMKIVALEAILNSHTTITKASKMRLDLMKMVKLKMAETWIKTRKK
jgi:hypothetical protein